MIPLLLALAATAQEPEELWLHANQAYDEGRYAAAVEHYETLVSAGAASGRVYYNLGNAYLRAGALGRAIAAYRRGERELPRDGDLQANLQFARQATKDAMAPPRPPALLRTIFFWHFHLGLRELQLATGACNVLFWSALAARRLRPASEWLGWVTWGLGVPLVALVGSWTLHWLSPDIQAVVVDDQVEVRAGTDSDAVVRFTVHEGTESRVRDRHDDWIRIQLSDGNSGWVPGSSVAIVGMPDQAKSAATIAN